MILEGLHEKEIFTEQYPFRLVVNTAEDFHYPLHWHNAVELVYNACGTCLLDMAGIEYHLVEGDFLLIPSGEIHEIISSSKRGKRYFIQFNISALDAFGGISEIKPFMEKVLQVGAKDGTDFHKSLVDCILALITEYEKKEFAYALSLNARVFDLLVILARNLAARTGISDSTGKDRKIAGLEQINHAFEYIEKNYSADIALKDVSSAVGFSEYHFSRLFKEYTGQNFHNYLNTYRVRQAEKLLRSSDKQISEIALETGFNSLVTFNRIFRKVKGCSPTLYRKAGM